MENPNHSNARYEEHDEREIKRAAFDRKEGYSKNYAAKEKDQMNGMPMPEHMKNKDCGY